MKEIRPEVLTQNIGDADVQYLRYPGKGPTVIALHATGFNPWLWHPIARDLTEHCQFIAPYFCDHRETDPEKGGLDWMLLAADLGEFCNRLNIDAPLFIGHSMGATIMTITNATMGNRAKKMILVEPIFMPQEFYKIEFHLEDHPLAAKAIKRKNQWDSKEQVRQYFKSKDFFKNWDEEMLELYIKYGVQQVDGEGVCLVCPPKREASLFMGSMKFDPWPVLSKNECPVLVVEGEISENNQIIDLVTVTDLLPNGTYHLVEGAGHLVTMEKPGIILDLIKQFLLDIR